MNSLNIVKIPCSMESAISHCIASQFTSVPKAYKKQNLLIYLNHRMHYLNNVDLRNLYIKSLDFTKENHQIKMTPSLDFSMFEQRDRYDKSSSSNWVRGFIAKN